jgi:FMN reductase
VGSNGQPPPPSNLKWPETQFGGKLHDRINRDLEPAMPPPPLDLRPDTPRPKPLRHQPPRPKNLRLVGFSGTLSRPSKTKALVDLALARAQASFGGSTESFDLGDLHPHLGQAEKLDDLPPAARRVVDTILGADALVLASPVYKGSYTGLFKHLFDLIDPEALRARPVLLAATGGGDKHALVIEHQLRPLLAFFEAASLPTGIYAGPADFTGGEPTARVLLDRIDRAVAQFAPWFGALTRSALAAAE